MRISAQRNAGLRHSSSHLSKWLHSVLSDTRRDTDDTKLKTNLLHHGVGRYFGADRRNHAGDPQSRIPGARISVCRSRRPRDRRKALQVPRGPAAFGSCITNPRRASAKLTMVQYLVSSVWKWMKMSLPVNVNIRHFVRPDWKFPPRKAEWRSARRRCLLLRSNSLLSSSSPTASCAAPS